jgi:hypothetical protein
MSYAALFHLVIVPHLVGSGAHRRAPLRLSENVGVLARAALDRQ